MQQTLNIKALYEYHLSTWFLLPATGYSKSDFDPFVFLNVFVANDYSHLYVRTVLSTKSLENNGSISMLTEENNCVLAIPINPIHVPDFQLYREGRYSEFTERLKGLILRGSSLPFKIDFETNNVEMDVRIAALLSEHRHVMEEALAEAIFSEEDRESGLEMLKEGIELLKKPEEHEFIETL